MPRDIEIIVKGPKGSGKSAIATTINDALKQRNIPVEVTGVDISTSSLNKVSGTVKIIEKIQTGLAIANFFRNLFK